ncbi:phosphoribosylformylglycinamidine synthase subunit PurS [Bacillus sp. 2205SS5-2]|uniref:phosphoribosylformylglycinamidine synthase subunit PurS n=1 Tax=Bacillus sp. 2205SS5-2 TaxID=3109031 RepID=UPI003007A105
MVNVKIYVTLKQSVLDPQGEAVKNALHSMNYAEVEDVRIGKYMELVLADTDDVEQKIMEMCERLLSNPVIEDYSFEIEERVAQ